MHAPGAQVLKSVVDCLKPSHVLDFERISRRYWGLSGNGTDISCISLPCRPALASKSSSRARFTDERDEGSSAVSVLDASLRDVD